VKDEEEDRGRQSTGRQSTGGGRRRKRRERGVGISRVNTPLFLFF